MCVFVLFFILQKPAFFIFFSRVSSRRAKASHVERVSDIRALQSAKFQGERT